MHSTRVFLNRVCLQGIHVHFIVFTSASFSLHRYCTFVCGYDPQVVDGEQGSFMYANSTGAVPPTLDLFNPDFTIFPALQLVSGFEAVVRA